MPNPWTNEIQLDELPKEMKDLAEVIGFQAVLRLLETYAGCTIYIPSRIVAVSRNRFISNSYNGRNVVEISRKTGLSERQIQRLVRKLRPRLPVVK